MTTTAAIANANDAYLFSGSTSYATALAAPASGVSDVADTTLFIGQQKSGTMFTIWQAFVEFGFTATDITSPSTAHIRLYSSSTTGTNVNRGLDIQKFDWGASVGTSDWRTPAQLALALNNRVASLDGIQNAGTGLALRAGVNDVALYDSSGTFRYVIESTRNRLQNTPSGLEYNGFRSGNYNGGGTGFSPTLFVGELQNSRLSRSLGCQVQLSDGSHMYLEFSSPLNGNDDNTLVHRSVSGTVRNLLTATNQTSPRRGAQTYGMCRDRRDNVYVINQSDTFNGLNCRAFIKSGNTWVNGTIRTGSLPTYGGEINNVAVTWHPQGGTYGTLVAVVGHRAAANNGTQLAYALINCDYLITGKGSLFRASGDAEGRLVALTAVDGFNNFANDTGTLLDISASTIGSARGFVMSTARHHVLGATSGQSLGRYTLNSSGTGFTEAVTFHDQHSGYSLKDANAKSRLLPISDTQYATVNVSPSTDFGIVVKHRQQQGNEFTVLADVRLGAQGIPSMGAPSTYAAANNWDAIYNPLDHRVWVYYFDQADPRRLMRTHVDLNTGQAGKDEVQVATAVGNTGSENRAIRVHRHHTIGEQVLISVANRTSGGTHSMIYLADTINVAPGQPTLLTKANFDATTAGEFRWDFHDPNAGDTQSAYQVQIDNVTTGSLAYDSGKVTSATALHTLPGASIANEEDWRWRVKVWDSKDAESRWSDYGFFTTSASGVVNITSPAVDNDPDIVTANYLVVWGVTGTTQKDYRVVVTRTDNGATLVNTGWITSTATNYLVEGMLSDIEWQVAVTVRDAANIESNTATRLITPNYNAPEVPIVTFDVMDEGGYIQLNITNPEPVGDRPNPTVNEIHRRVYSPTSPDGKYERLGSTEPNGTFKDFCAASGVLYEYRVRAIAGEYFTDSTETVADRELELQGIWLHDPADPADTIRQFLYGKDNRSTAIEIMGTTQHFAGREFPVTDFGEHEEEDISITVDIPHGPTHRVEEADLREFMEMRKTLYLRDNRGRACYGTMSGYQQNDQSWGVTVGFKFGRVSLKIEEV